MTPQDAREAAAEEEAVVMAARADEWSAPVPKRSRLNLPPYPGEDAPTKQPVSKFRDDGTCTFCDHFRNDHGDKNCGMHLTAGIFCRCPYSKDTK